MDFTQIDWVAVLPRFGIDEAYLCKKQGPCPCCGGKTRFRFRNHRGMGDWYCNSCGPGIGFTLIEHLNPDLTRRDIFKRLEDYTGVKSDPNHAITPLKVQTEMSPQEVAKNRSRLMKAWKGTRRRTSNDPLSKYLHKRVPGIDLSRFTDEVRLHPQMDFREEVSPRKWETLGRHPVMLARAVDGSKKPITLHRTYLTKDGDKAPYENCKKQMAGVAYLNGAAIRLVDVPGSRVLALAEGIETAAAVATAYGYRFNVWAMLNAGNLGVADIPAGMFDEVIIFADHDKIDPKRGFRPGEHYAKKLQAALLERGIKCTVKIPPKEGQDFCDLWVDYFNSRLQKKAPAVAQSQVNNIKTILRTGSMAPGYQVSRRINRPREPVGSEMAAA